MKELEMNKIEEKANKIVNRKENEIDDLIPSVFCRIFYFYNIFLFIWSFV